MNPQPITPDPVREWLGAYLDNELTGERRAWVETHLADCPACQRELAELRALSSLLGDDPAPVPAQTAAAFAGQVIRHLPSANRPFWPRLLRNGLRYAPLAMFGVWAFFISAALVTQTLLVVVNWFPGAQALLPFVQSAPPVSGEGFLASLLDAIGQTALAGDLNTVQQALSALSGFATLTFLSLALSIIIAILFSAWLAGLWAARSNPARERFERK